MAVLYWARFIFLFLMVGLVAYFTVALFFFERSRKRK